ncbi:MAG: potassium transporter TrkA [Actinobacteria bacterium]|nr:potassium transporter TrkA [Actinomycetota bacterium]
MRKVTLADRLRYRFDNTISKGTVALIGWLFVVLLALVLMSSLLVYLTGIAPGVGEQSPGFFDTLWFNLMRTIDPGNVGGDEGSWPFLLSMLAVTAGGILVFSTLIGVIFTGIDDKLAELRKGRSFVVERGHTIIYGWSPEVFSIVAELVTANESRQDSRQGACIAILAEKDKVEMEDEIRDRVGRTGNTRVVCRTGDPINIDDVELVNPNDARSIIVLPPEGEEADSRVIKTILALTNNPNRREEPYHIVSRIRDPENLGVAQMVGRAELELVAVDDLIARITAQTCRQSGLSVVYTDLLDFGGDEIYFVREPRLTGRTFGEALTAYESCSVIGLRTREGRIELSPPADTKISEEDAIILISADDSEIALSEHSDREIDTSAIRKPSPREQVPERTLVLGWNDRAPTIVAELDHYVHPGSEVTVVTPEGAGPASRFDDLRHQTVTLREGTTTDRRTLDEVAVSSYDHVIVLGDSDDPDPNAADSKTLVTLLHLREIADESERPFSIVSEMLDVRNRELAEITHADDFIVSDHLASLMMCQVSENKELSAVFEELISPEGSELYLKPAREYVEPGAPLDFYTVVEAARRRGEVAVGYRLKAEAGDPNTSYGVHLNPDKSRRITFTEHDRLIVLAES